MITSHQQAFGLFNHNPIVYLFRQLDHFIGHLLKLAALLNADLYHWNQGLGNKFVNEIVFLAFHIVPVYEVAYFADVLVLNSIEFWSGSNPIAQVGTEKTVQGENGEYLVRTNADGYTIIKKGEEDKPLDLVYNKEKRTWNAVADGQTFELITMNEDGTITFKQKDGTPMTVTPDMMGMSVARAAQNNSLFFAAR